MAGRLVRKEGLEPSRCYPQVPETCASTSSATFAAGPGRIAATARPVKPIAPPTEALDGRDRQIPARSLDVNARAAGPALVVERAAAVADLGDVLESHVHVAAGEVRARVEGFVRGQAQRDVAARGGHVDGLQTGAVETETHVSRGCLGRKFFD